MSTSSTTPAAAAPLTRRVTGNLIDRRVLRPTLDAQALNDGCEHCAARLARNQASMVSLLQRVADEGLLPVALFTQLVDVAAQWARDDAELEHDLHGERFEERSVAGFADRLVTDLRTAERTAEKTEPAPLATAGLQAHEGRNGHRTE